MKSIVEHRNWSEFNDTVLFEYIIPDAMRLYKIHLSWDGHTGKKSHWAWLESGDGTVTYWYSAFWGSSFSWSFEATGLELPKGAALVVEKPEAIFSGAMALCIAYEDMEPCTD